MSSGTTAQQRAEALLAALGAQVEARAADLAAFGTLVAGAASSGKLPDLDTVPREVLATGGAAFAAALVLAIGPARRAVAAALDTALASVLLVALAALLVSLPFGELLYRAASCP